jgi:hypothetical protein
MVLAPCGSFPTDDCVLGLLCAFAGRLRSICERGLSVGRRSAFIGVIKLLLTLQLGNK